MTRLVDQVLDKLRADARIDASMLAIRIDALARFRRATEPYLPAEWLQPARAVANHAGERLALSRAHTVVAVAGTTGSGKSSIFNALVGLNLSPVGIRRPTTGAAHACVWGPPEEAAPVLDWLGVSLEHRFTRESALDADDQARLRGLILLDLPDFDSVEQDHAIEVGRLLELVDLMVWVVDPQKYADQVLHEQHLRRYRQHRAVTAVALNHTDRLAGEDVDRLLADLQTLLVADGLDGVPIIATSAVHGPTGLTDLRAALENAVTSRRAALQRLAADVDEVVDGLSDLVGPPAPDLAVDRIPELLSGLAEAGGVTVTTEAVGATYQAQATAAMGWPPLRFVRSMAALATGGQPDRRGGGGGAWQGGHRRPPPTEPGPVPPDPARAQAAASIAARAVAARASDGLPPPWPDAVLTASRSRVFELPAALRRATTLVPDFDGGATPWWWRLVSGGQWLAAGVALVGACWLLVGWVLQLVSLPLTHPQAGPISLPAMLLAGGLLGGALLAAAVQPLVRWASRRAQARTARRLRAGLVAVGHEYVFAPVHEVLQAYEEARAAWHAAAPAGGRPSRRRSA